MTFLESVVIAIFEDYHLPITDCDWSLGGGVSSQKSYAIRFQSKNIWPMTFV